MTDALPQTIDDQAPDGAANRRPALLIADDEPIARVALATRLRSDFRLVGIAHDDAGAVELAARERPDVALLDAQMPIIGGLQATRAIREVSPTTAIVILSMDESDASVVEFLNAGAVAYLRKGIRGDELVERLHQSIAAHSVLNGEHSR